MHKPIEKLSLSFVSDPRGLENVRLKDLPCSNISGKHLSFIERISADGNGDVG
jgi:hypothetical protein